MNEVRRRRGLALLGGALLVEAILSLIPANSPRAAGDQGAASQVLLILTHSLLPAGLALFLFASIRQEGFVLIAVRAAFVTIVGIQAYGLVVQMMTWSRGSATYMFQPASSLLISLGAPVLWASALARRDHPGDPGLQKFGRISAGLIQLGFVFQFVVRIRTSAYWRYNFDQASLAGGALALEAILEIAADLMLLAASIQAMRAPTDEEAVVRRAVRTHRLMMWHLILVPLASGLFYLANYLQTASGSMDWIGAGLWQLAFYPSLLVATTFVLARWYLLQFPSTVSPLTRSGGVESTGESS